MHIHCIGGSRLNHRTVPNVSDVVISTGIGGLLEVVMQRHVEDTELYTGDEFHSGALPRTNLTCAPIPSRY